MKSPWQKDTHCRMRTVADVSAVADPATGVAVYDTYENPFARTADHRRWHQRLRPLHRRLIGLKGNGSTFTSRTPTTTEAPFDVVGGQHRAAATTCATG